MSKRVSIVALLATFMLLFTLLVPVGATLTPGPQPDDVNPFDDFIEHCQEYVSFVGDGSTIPDHSEIYGKTSFAGSFFMRPRLPRAVFMGWWAIAVAETTTLTMNGDEFHVRWDFPGQRPVRAATADGRRFSPYTAYIEAAGELTQVGPNTWMGFAEVTESYRHRFFTAVNAPQIFALQSSSPPGTPVYLVVEKGTNGAKETANWFGCLGTVVPFLRGLQPLLTPPAFPDRTSRVVICHFDETRVSGEHEHPMPPFFTVPDNQTPGPNNPIDLVGDYVISYVGVGTPTQDQQDFCTQFGGTVVSTSLAAAQDEHNAQLIFRGAGYPTAP